MINRGAGSDTANFVRREIAASIVMSAMLSLLFFLLVFRVPVVPVWGQGGYIMDFMPQGFFVAFMSVMWPGTMARRALKKGTIQPLSQTTPLPRSLFLCALLMGVAGVVVSVGIASAVLALAGVESLSQVAAGAAKMAWGATLAAIVTPLGLRTALAG